MPAAAKKTIHSVKKKAGKVLDRAAHHASPYIERRFNFLMWLMVLWVVVMLFCPLFLNEILSVAYDNRNGVFADFGHVGTFQTAADAMFIIACLISVVMLVSMLIITILYIRATWRDRDERHEHQTLTNNHKFRYTWLIFGLVAMIFVSCAALINITCSDSDVFQREGMILKFINLNKTDNIKKYASLAVGYGYGGSAVDPTNMFSDGVMIADGFMGNDGAGGIKVITKDTLWSKQGQGLLKYHTSTGDVAINNTFLLSLFANPTVLNITINGDTILFTPPSSMSLAEQMNLTMSTISVSNAGLYVSELVDTTSAVYKALTSESAGAIKVASMMSYRVNTDYRAGVGLALLQQMQTHLNKKALMSVPDDNTVDVNVILNAARYCRVGTAFSSVIFSLCILGLLCGLIIYISIKKCAILCDRVTHSEYPKRRQHYDDYATVAHDDDSEEGWNVTTPLSSV